MLRDEMEMTKRRVGINNAREPIIERIRGYVTVEGEEQTQDFQLSCRFNDLTVKGLKNSENRLPPQQLGLLIYGRNLKSDDGQVHPVVIEALKCSRTNLVEKKKLRTVDSITEDELKMLDEKYLGEEMPEGTGAKWEYIGFCYQNMSSMENERLYHHPNREFLVKRYIAEINEQIGDYNRGVMKEWQADASKYE